MNRAEVARINIAFIVLIVAVATIGGFMFGYDSGVINGTQEGLESAFDLSKLGTGFNVGAILLGCAVILARQRFMLKAPGTIPVALLPGATTRWQYGVGRYAGGELRWYRSLGVGTRPNRILQRRDVTVLGRRDPLPSEQQALPSSAVVVECRDHGAPLSLALGESAYTGFVSWLESSAPLS